LAPQFFLASSQIFGLVTLLLSSIFRRSKEEKLKLTFLLNNLWVLFFRVTLYLVVVITSDGRRNKEIDTRIGKANVVLRELCRSVVTKWDLSNTANLAVFKMSFVPILTYGRESLVLTVRVIPQVQAAEMGFLRRVHGVELRDKVRSCEIRKALNVELLLRIERS